ncbi:hypothetical protein PUNSTDRAFT_125979 [Punctularia strigosozonata HHB-11173 SS5]|uniref:uncharacterized protein n=1 Tax=Punctularia strigosozonata (strain HHB-11173) TaxID=741275 RepID=UPI00044173CA|nr:uncharacterized protein PUNSTDRAFT_125979 [Punctularia strigosozonata HHB-11173 SS5]EIN10058.1 hypothetical protein PUNSTDRAFT_125979 [Punctularia strigosozonata HHB-11173 SS5]
MASGRPAAMPLSSLNKSQTQPGASIPRPITPSSVLNKRVLSESYVSSGNHANGSKRFSGLNGGEEEAAPLDLLPTLHKGLPSVVKTRTGSVLSRGFILKTDHYPSGRALDLDINVHGAPNFRAPRQADLNVFGVAQPRTQGLRAILSILRARPNTVNPTHVVWFSTREEPIVYISGRPFVLRDASEPRRTLKLSDRAENLEDIEQRLRHDILLESTKYGGLILTHNEVGSGDGEGAIIPTWTHVDATNVKTSRELWENMRDEGWNLEYHRIPISPDRPIEDNYLDAYVRVISNTDPLRSALVFSCGMGAVRTTFAMCAAIITRRRQLIQRGLPDPYIDPNAKSGTDSGIATPSPPEARIAQIVEQANAQQDSNRALLRLTYVLQQILADDKSQSASAIELLLTQPLLLDNLRRAHMGNYGIILSLLGVLDHGLKAKKLVDRVIDSCDHVTNLREAIFSQRIQYSLTTSMDELDDAKREDILNRAVRSLEKYFFLIAFANYIDEQLDFGTSFSSWLKARTEIWNQVTFLRKVYGSRLNIFAPVNDLSALSRTGSESRAIAPGQSNDVEISGGRILGDEYSEHILRNRSGIILREGTLLKSDLWLGESQRVERGVRGAINFRNIPGTRIYALGQPTVDAVDEVIDRIRADHPKTWKIVWITLREEPIVYVNGAPYCLRRERFALRNLKDYSGISASRLEVLEDRLREDVLGELSTFGGRLLLHTEAADGAVIPVWEDVSPDGVVVLKEVMAARSAKEDDIELVHVRIPMTAERPPDFSDLSDLIEVAIRTETADTPIVVNCQLGRGRSTLTSVILLLIQQWLDASRPSDPRLHRSMSIMSMNAMDDLADLQVVPRHSYQVINNLLRVIRRGRAVKNAVDAAIDQCGEVENLRDAIEEARICAEQTADEGQKRAWAQKGLQNLRRYFALIVFQAYLQSIEPDTRESFESFESFVNHRPVLKTFEKELLSDGLQALQPLERVELAEGEAFPDEVKQVVANRSGVILSASTILKSDFFSNLQKMSLPERIEGSPNFRRIPLILKLASSSTSGSSSPSDRADFVPSFSDEAKMVCGTGMPTVQGLKAALARVDAGPQGRNHVIWTSLREEPVIYVAGRPHVLRLIEKPLENVEATGVTTAMVESMEESLKRDVLREVKAGSGRILLHDEVEERPNVFAIVPIWENVSEADIMTPRDVFNLVSAEGYKVDYGRVAITDEQAPLPDALSLLVDRVRAGLDKAGDFIFNCQMGRGRTTSGMVVACLIASTARWEQQRLDSGQSPLPEAEGGEAYDAVDGFSEEQAYLQGEYKIILQLVGVLSHGKVAKRLTDRAIDLMQDVQNLRKAVYDYKLKVEAAPKGSPKQRKLFDLGVNYLYRYGTLIVLANYLLEMREQGWPPVKFPDWLQEHREITKLLQRRSLD